VGSLPTGKPDWESCAVLAGASRRGNANVVTGSAGAVAEIVEAPATEMASGVVVPEEGEGVAAELDVGELIAGEPGAEKSNDLYRVSVRRREG
jgi:hypothetical protein